MSAPIDVLAILRDPHYDLRSREEMLVAADAVAELIAAASDIPTTEPPAWTDSKVGEVAHYWITRQAVERLRAALKAVQA